tara:strand:+ start:308 stop:424 length:117 start_codon:yes stop_codon:yes gene_type:complete
MFTINNVDYKLQMSLNVVLEGVSWKAPDIGFISKQENK